MPIASHLLVWALVSKSERPNSLCLLLWTTQRVFLGTKMFHPFLGKKISVRFRGDLLDATGSSSVAMALAVITEQKARKPAQIPEDFADPDAFAQHL